MEEEGSDLESRQPGWTGKELWPRRYEDGPSLPFAPKEGTRTNAIKFSSSKTMHQPRHQMPPEETELLESLCPPRMPKTPAESRAMALDPKAHQMFTKLFKQMDKGNDGFTRWSRLLPGPRSIDEEDTENEHHKHFMTLIKESEGCYIPKVPQGVNIFFPIYPTAVPPEMFYLLEQAAKEALTWYNKQNYEEEEPYELVRVECGSTIVNNGFYYIVAFIARGSRSGVEFPFRARVFSGSIGNNPGKYVQYCRHASRSCATYTRLNGWCCEASSQVNK